MFGWIVNANRFFRWEQQLKSGHNNEKRPQALKLELMIVFQQLT